MKIAKYFRNYTFVLVISVILLSVMTMRVAYSAIFAVATTPNIQEINTGTLNVVIDNNLSEEIDIEELFPSVDGLPTSAGEEGNGDNYATLYVSNTGTLDGDFSVSISYQDPEDIPSQYSGKRFVSFDYLIVGIYDVTESEWVLFGSSLYKQIGDIVPNADGEYPILRDQISAPATQPGTVRKEYHIYIWLREDTPASEIGKLAYLKLNVKSTPLGE